jgi:AraC family transcriptional regulator
MAAGAHGRRLANTFHATCEDTAHARTPSGMPMALTRLRSSRQESVLSQAFTTEDAYLVVIYLDAPRELVIHLRDGRVRRKVSVRDDTVILDLQTAPRLSSSGGFHSLNFYLPRRAIFDACGTPSEGASLRSNIVSSDPVLLNLARGLSLASSDARVLSVGEFTQHMLLAVCTRLNARYRGAQIDPKTRSPGLPIEKRDAAVAFMRSHLDTPISMTDVASACGLSYRVFVRAFKRALGTSPYDWFMASRIERAKELMSDPNLRLVDIAAQMGFADQSHFHRAFHRYIGVSPGMWRGNQLTGH